MYEGWAITSWNRMKNANLSFLPLNYALLPLSKGKKTTRLTLYLEIQ